MQKNSTQTLKLVRSGIISALYVVLSFIVMPISGGAMQFRPSEALTLLPLLYLESVPALFIGCFIFNLISGLPILDVVFGSLVTLVAGICTYLVGKKIQSIPLKVVFGGLFPVLLNAFLLPIVWYYVYGELQLMYIISVLSLLLSQSLSVYALGSWLYVGALRLKEKGVKYLENQKTFPSIHCEITKIYSSQLQ